VNGNATLNTTLNGTVYFCLCNSGWTGTLCNISVVDYCVDVNCTHNGTCRSETNGYVCSCPIGFEGVNCETPKVDQCADGIKNGAEEGVDCGTGCVRKCGTNSLITVDFKYNDLTTCDASCVQAIKEWIEDSTGTTNVVNVTALDGKLVITTSADSNVTGNITALFESCVEVGCDVGGQQLVVRAVNQQAVYMCNGEPSNLPCVTTEPSEKKSSANALPVVLGVLVLVFFVFGGAWAWRKNQKLEKEKLLHQNESGISRIRGSSSGPRNGRNVELTSLRLPKKGVMSDEHKEDNKDALDTEAPASP